jgi:hypothetical protein
MAMRKILLVSTGVDWDISTYELFFDLPFVGTRAIMAPLHIATIAALTPDDIEVDLWDEPVHGRIDELTQFQQILTDKTLTDEVLLKTFVDFAAGWRKEGDPFSEHHKSVLYGIVEHIVARENRVAEDTCYDFAQGDQPVPDINPGVNKAMFADEMLKAINQELRARSVNHDQGFIELP